MSDPFGVAFTDTLDFPYSDSVRQGKGSWKKVVGSFCAVNAALVSGSNRLSPTGIAPSSHLGNGCLDLLLVHKCSRLNFLRHLSRLSSSGNHVSQSVLRFFLKNIFNPNHRKLIKLQDEVVFSSGLFELRSIELELN